MQQHNDILTPTLNSYKNNNSSVRSSSTFAFLPSIDVLDQFLLQATADAAALEFSLARGGGARKNSRSNGDDDDDQQNDDYEMFSSAQESCMIHLRVAQEYFATASIPNSNNNNNINMSSRLPVSVVENFRRQLSPLISKLENLVELCKTNNDQNNNVLCHQSLNAFQEELLDLLESERKDNAELRKEVEALKHQIILLRQNNNNDNSNMIPSSRGFLAPPPPMSRPISNRAPSSPQTIQNNIIKSSSSSSLVQRSKFQIQALLTQLRFSCQSLKQQALEIRKEVRVRCIVLNQHLSQFSSASGNDAEIARMLYQRELALRKHYYNLVQDLRGQIRVFCRVRPFVNCYNYNEQNSSSIVTSIEPVVGETLTVMTERGTEKRFEFDAVFGPESTQKDVFAETSALVESVIDGYNVCILSFGMTSSGKTFTMMNNNNNNNDDQYEEAGISRRSIIRLFDILDEKRRMQQERSTVVTMTCLEIYLEKIRDLLVAPEEQQPSYHVVRGGDNNNGNNNSTLLTNSYYVPNLAEATLNSIDDFDQVFAYAEQNRSTGATLMNEQSSRSHLVCQITVRCENAQTGETSLGKLSLVDLAGSERLDKSGSTGLQRKEAVTINSSLSALGDVIAALSVSAKHVPYRNSVLTHLLTDSLGGGSKVLMICCVSPSELHTSETLSTLNFGSRARGVAFGKVKKN